MPHSDLFTSFIWPYVNFFIFIAILCKFGRKPLADLANQKKQDFDVLANAAEKAQADAKKRAMDLDERLRGLQQETDHIAKKAEQEAKKLVEKTIADAQKVSKQLLDESQRLGEQELRSAQQQLHREIEEALTKAFEKKIRENFQADDHSKFIHHGLNVLDQKPQLEQGAGA